MQTLLNSYFPFFPLNSSTVADPDSELRRGAGFNLLAQPALLPLVISYFFTQNKGGGGRGPQVPPLDLPLKAT